jgi:hypothetical protein
MSLQLTGASKEDPKAPKQAKAPKSAATKLVVGGPPRADLLPPEVAQGVKAKSLRRTLVLLVVLAVVVAGAGSLGSTLLALNSTVALEASSARTAELLAQQGEYSEVRQVTAMLDKAEIARRVGTSTEINWKSYTAEVQSSLPADTVITGLIAEASTPTSTYSAPTIPLQGDRIGQVAFTATSASLPDVESWLVNLAGVTGFVDASPGAVTRVDDGSYTVSIIMHFNSDVLAERFALEETDSE